MAHKLVAFMWCNSHLEAQIISRDEQVVTLELLKINNCFFEGSPVLILDLSNTKTILHPIPFVCVDVLRGNEPSLVETKEYSTIN